MPPKQATLGKFFTLPAGTKPPVKEQSKLAFSSKAKNKEAEQKLSSSPESPPAAAKDGEDNDDVDMTGVEDKVEKSTEVKKASRKRKSPDRETAAPSSAAVDDAGEDDEPVTKRKRGRPAKKVVESSPEPEPKVEPTRNPSPVRKAKKKASKSEDEGEPAATKKGKKKVTKSEDEDEPAPAKSGKAVKEKPKEKAKAGSTKKRKSASPSPVPVEKLSLEQKEDPDASASDAEAPLLDDSDEEASAALVKKAQQVQKLVGAKKHPYPDWKEGTPVPYAALCKTFELIDGTRKRLEITAHTSLFLQQVLRLNGNLNPNELVTVVHLMLNKLAADYIGIELGIGESLIMKAISESTGRTMDKLKAAHAEVGDLGVIAYQSRNAQPTMFKPQPLTVEKIFKGLYKVATTKGDGAQGMKVGEIKKLLAACQGEEAKFLVRGLEGKLRLGLADATILQAVAQATITWEKEKAGKTAKPTDLVAAENILKEVYSGLPSYEAVIPKMIEHGIMNLKEHCTMQPGVPLKPMLAKPTKSITEVLDRFESKRFTCEFKYDGERAQIHYVSPKSKDVFTSTKDDPKKGLAAIFSRNSENLSTKYPDILGVLDKWVNEETTSFILDCETTAVDKETAKLLPFQTLMTRKKKDVAVEDVKVKVCVYAFDLLFLNGEPLVHKSLAERRDAMRVAFKEVEGEFGYARHSDVDQVDEIQAFLEESVKGQCEGLMVKMLDGEESYYTPSKRSQNWLKVKKDYLSGTGDSLDLVVLGAYHGKGKRTSVYGAFLLACYNPSSEEYETVCNIGTGFSEELLASLHKQLTPFIIPKPKPYYAHSSVPKDQPDVWFEPKVVWEVLCADLTLSPRYKAAVDSVDAGGKGVSLRFPRYIRERDDKKPESATTGRQVAEMYRAQDSVSGGKSKGGIDDDWEY